MACLLCGRGELALQVRKDGYDVRSCESCGLVQLDPLPPAALRASLYGNAYFASEAREIGYQDYAAQETEYVTTFAEDLRCIAAWVPHGSVLDVGCGYGYFLQAAAAAGYHPFGVDVAGHAVQVAAKRFAGHVFEGVLETIPELAGRAFDVVFASHVVEHVAAPRAFVTGLADRLSERGVLVLVTPNVRSLLARLSGSRWVSYKFPEHVAFYDPHTIRHLLEASGLEVLTIDPAYQHYRLSFVAHRVRELIRPMDKLVPRVERHRLLRDRMVRVTSGSLRVIARRRQRGYA